MSSVMELEVELDAGFEPNEFEGEQLVDVDTASDLPPDETNDAETETEPPGDETNTLADETPTSTFTMGLAGPGDSGKTPQQLAVDSFRQELTEATDRLAKAALERLEIEAALKSAKGEEKSALESLAKITKRGPLPATTFDKSPPADQIEQPTDAGNQAAPTGLFDGPDKSANPEQEPWRKVTLSELSSYGLKSSTADKLIEAGYETFGQLVDLRTEISNHRAKWPKGIGQAKITQIENAEIEWFAKNRDVAVLQQAASGSPVDPTPPVAEAACDEPPEPNEWNDLSEDDQIAFVNKRGDEINTGEENSLFVAHPDGSKFWDSGAEAYKRGDLLRHCPYVPGPEMDDWIRGWFGAATIDDYEGDEPTVFAETKVNVMDL